jgi:hypothetical protein
MGYMYLKSHGIHVFKKPWNTRYLKSHGIHVFKKPWDTCI